MEISKKIDTLVDYSIRNNFIEKEDEIYSKNTLMDILNLDDLKVFDEVEINDNIQIPNLADTQILLFSKFNKLPSITMKNIRKNRINLRR